MAARKHRFATTALASIITQTIGMGLSLGWVFIISRLVDVASAGRAFLGISAANTAMAIFSFGLPHAFAVGARQMDDRALVSNALVATFSMGLLAAVAMLVVGFYAMDGPDYVVHGVRLLPLIAFSLFINTLSVTILRALGAFTSSNVAALTLLTLFNVELLYHWRVGTPLSASAVLEIYARAASISAVLSLIQILVREGFSLASVTVARLRGMFSFGGRVQAGNVLKEVMYRSSLYLVGWQLGALAAGYYGLVLRILEAASRFVDSVGLVLVPMIARGQGEAERKHIALAAISSIVPVMAVATVPICLFADIIVVRLLGPQYREAGPVLRVAIFAIIPLSAWKLLANDLIARTLVRPYILSCAAGALAMAGLNLLLLPEFGIVAASYILTLSYSLSLAILLFVATRSLGYRWSDLLFYAAGRARRRVAAGRRRQPEAIDSQLE